MRLGKTKVPKIKFQVQKIKSWDVDVDNIVISKITETKNNFKYLIGY